MPGNAAHCCFLYLNIARVGVELNFPAITGAPTPASLRNAIANNRHFISQLRLFFSLATSFPIPFWSDLMVWGWLEMLERFRVHKSVGASVTGHPPTAVIWTLLSSKVIAIWSALFTPIRSRSIDTFPSPKHNSVSFNYIPLYFER